MEWFFAAGDAPFFFFDELRELSFFPDLWRGQEELGVSSLPLLWIDYPFRLITFLLFQIGFSWFWIDKFWWILVFSLAAFGAYTLTRSWLGSLIYSTNTYILLLFDGGQLGVALAYGCFPWVVSRAIAYISNKASKRETIQFGLLLGVFLFLDIRLAYIFLLLLILFVLMFYRNKTLHISAHSFLIPVIVLGMNSFWLIPAVLYRDSLGSALSNAISTGGDLSFFSVADFSHSLSLLHPNYPENLFGKVYFFKPEFLIIPMLAFFLFLNTKMSGVYISFGLIGLLGAFLGKGVQEPFGGIYEWLFNTIPGFFLFRDPTKWYVLTAVAYCVLIPKSLGMVSKRFSGIVFVVFWLFTLRFVFSGTVNGNITPPVMTKDYIVLKNILLADNMFGRTLWLPTPEPYAFRSNLHPAVSSQAVFLERSADKIISLFDNPETIQTIKAYGISYVIVPQDIEQKIFLKDYSFDPSLRDAIIAKLDSIPDLHRLSGFDRLAVYTISNSEGLVSLSGEQLSAEVLDQDSWSIVFPSRNEEGVLSVKYNYDPNWRLKVGDYALAPIRSDRNFMHFVVPKGFAQEGTLLYLPTQAANAGAVVSFITFGIAIIALIRLKK
jgi:hypothetical protein